MSIDNSVCFICNRDIENENYVKTRKNYFPVNYCGDCYKELRKDPDRSPSPLNVQTVKKDSEDSKVHEVVILTDKERWLEYRNRISMGIGLEGEQTDWIFNKALETIERQGDTSVNVPHIKFGGEKYVRMALLKEAEGIIKRQSKEIDGFNYVLENRNELGRELQKANEEIAQIIEVKRLLELENKALKDIK